VIVLDASVLVEVLLGRPHAVERIERELGGAQRQAFHAPDLIEPEALNALRRLVRARAITQHRAEQAVAHLGDARLIRYPHAPLRARVWALRDALSAYDAPYVALTEVLDEAVLLTADRGLAAVAARLIGAARIRHLA
jgi:predicted nucleic acid-binding protein